MARAAGADHRAEPPARRAQGEDDRARHAQQPAATTASTTRRGVTLVDRPHADEQCGGREGHGKGTSQTVRRGAARAIGEGEVHEPTTGRAVWIASEPLTANRYGVSDPSRPFTVVGPIASASIGSERAAIVASLHTVVPAGPGQVLQPLGQVHGVADQACTRGVPRCRAAPRRRRRSTGRCPSPNGARPSAAQV